MTPSTYFALANNAAIYAKIIKTSLLEFRTKLFIY